LAVPWAEFEEKQYEIAAAIELGRRGDVFGAGQVLERIVGYDAAATPSSDHPLWRVLRVPRPAGLRLLPSHWHGERQPRPEALPSALVSLILQYKRPEYLQRANAKQWRFWGRPYFRITRGSHQQRILLRLERNLGPAAIVRYAAPAFWQRGELEAAQLSHDVLLRSGYVRPSDFGRHHVWTYNEPGVDGRANPAGPRRPFETFETVLFQEQLSGLSEMALFEGLPQHLRGVGEAAMARNPTLRRNVEVWLRTLFSRDLGLTANQIWQLGDLAAIVSVTDQIGASWHLRRA
jgi:hypothetical protein